MKPIGELYGIWEDGRLSRRSRVDPGLVNGLGVFETLLMTQGRVLALDRHLRRLAAGAERLGLPVPAQSQIEEALAALTQAGRSHQNARLRLTWTPGQHLQGRLLGTLGPYLPAESATVQVSPFHRNENSAIAGVKSTSYAENLVALKAAIQNGADEPIFSNSRGELSEGATSNIFIERDGELLTPPLRSGCLPGITRELCLEWGRQAGLPIREVTLPVSVMNTTSHAALTSALKGVLPVRAVDGRVIETGPLTRQLIGLYTFKREQILTEAKHRSGGA